MKRVWATIITALILFGFSLFAGVSVFFVKGLFHEFNQAEDKLTYISLLPGAIVFITSAALLVFGIPGIIAAIGAATLLTSRLGKYPEIALFGSGLVGFFGFKGFFWLGEFLAGKGGVDSMNQMAAGLAAVGFGLSALALSLLWPHGIMGSTQNQKPFGERLKSGLLYRKIPALIIFIGVMVYYFHIHRI